MTEEEARAAVVREALTWSGTPFHWGACVKDAGVDCGRFLAAAVSDAGVQQIDMKSFPPISPQWFLHKAEDEESPFIEQIKRFAVEYEITPGRVPQPGDIVVAKIGRDYAHSAIVIDWPKVIGAASGFRVTVWRDIHRSPQYGTRQLRYFDPFTSVKMFKGGTNTSALTQPHGINVQSAAYGKAVRLIYGLTQAKPDLVWYNDWESGDSPSNATLAALTGSSGGKKTPKAGKKGGGSQAYYSAALDLLLGHAPVRGILSAWYNNQKFAVIPCSASGFVSSGAFSFTPVAANSTTTITGTVPGTGPYVVTASDFVSDLNDVVAGGVALQPAAPAPGAGQYSVDGSGNYTFNAAQAGDAYSITYRKTATGSASTLVAIYAATVAETFSQTFNDYGAPGSRTVYGTWERPLWNASFGVPGRIDTGAYRARDPYTWWWDGSTAAANFPTGLEGLPVTVYYGVPAIFKSDGTFFSGTLTPIEILNLEFEEAFASGAEYSAHSDQQLIQNWCCGLGSARFDLGLANAMPNLNLETIGAFTQWPNGDADVADVVADIMASGPVLT